MKITPVNLLLCAALLAPSAALAAPAANRAPAPQALVTEAEELALTGDFDNALPLYERAIAALSGQPAEQQALRYRYGMVLNALGGQARPDLYPLARSQFQSVLRYLERGNREPEQSGRNQEPGGPGFEHSTARVRSALAHTYHQQSASEGGPRRAQLLRSAYQLYSSATAELARERDWHNLSITYFNLGQVCEWQGNLEEAIEWLEKAVKLDRQHGFPDLEEDQAYLLALRQQANPSVSIGTTSL